MEFTEQQITEIVGEIVRQMDAHSLVQEQKKPQPAPITAVQAVDNEVLKTIAVRRSIRKFKRDPIKKEWLDVLLKAALEAPSAHNSQPYHFSIVQNKSVLNEMNEEISKMVKQGVGDVFYGAPTVVFISNDPSEYWSKVDSGIAVQNIALAAQSLGLGSVILAFPDAAFAGTRKEYFCKRLVFPKGYEYAVSIAIGVPDCLPPSAHSIAPGKVSYL